MTQFPAKIRHLHISHNAPYLSSIPLGTAVIPRRNEKQRLCHFFLGGGGWGATKVHYRVCMRRWRIYTDCLATDLACDQVNLLCDLNCTAVRTKLLEKDLSLK